MSHQKFKTTVFVPRLTEITTIIEVEVDPHDSKSDIEYKLLKRLSIYKESNCCLLKKAGHSQPSLMKLIDFRKIHKNGANK